MVHCFKIHNVFFSQESETTKTQHNCHLGNDFVVNSGQTALKAFLKKKYDEASYNAMLSKQSNILCNATMGVLCNATIKQRSNVRGMSIHH